MKSLWSGFLSLQGKLFAPMEKALVMKNGICAVAHDNDALYFLVHGGYGFAFQMSENKTAGWLLEGGTWKPADCSWFPIAYLVNPHIRAQQIALAIADLINAASNSKIIESLRDVAAAGSQFFPESGIKVIKNFLERLPHKNMIFTLLNSPYPNTTVWSLIRLALSCADSHDLISQNPAVALLASVVSRDKMDALMKLKRRKILSLSGFNGSESELRILEKIDPTLVEPTNITRIHSSLADERMAKNLRHVSRITPDIMLLVSRETCWPLLSPSLVIEIAASEKHNTVEELFEILRHKNDIPDFNCPTFKSARQVSECHKKLMRMIYDRERSWEKNLSNQKFPDPPFPGHPPFEGEEFIIPITSHDELSIESSKMHHCIITYARKILEGKCYVYRVTAPERATLCIDCKTDSGGWQLTRNNVRLACNARPSPGTYNIIMRWLQANSISFEN